jgi:hypothetical protein
MSEGANELVYELNRAMRHGCTVTYRPRREWLGIGIEVQKEHEGLMYTNTQIVSQKEMSNIIEPTRLLADTLRGLVNSILDKENAS